MDFNPDPTPQDMERFRKITDAAQQLRSSYRLEKYKHVFFMSGVSSLTLLIMMLADQFNDIHVVAMTLLPPVVATITSICLDNTKDWVTRRRFRKELRKLTDEMIEEMKQEAEKTDD